METSTAASDVNIILNNTGSGVDDEDNWNGISGSGDDGDGGDGNTSPPFTSMTTFRSDENKSRESDGDSNFHIIAATATIAAILIIFLIILIIICLRRRRLRRKAKERERARNQNIELANRAMNRRPEARGNGANAAGENKRLYSDSSGGPPLTAAPPPPYPSAAASAAAAGPHDTPSSDHKYYTAREVEPNHYEEIPCNIDNTGKDISSSTSGNDKGATKNNRKEGSPHDEDPESRVALLSREKAKGNDYRDEPTNKEK